MDYDPRDIFQIPTIITLDNCGDPADFQRMIDNALAVDLFTSGEISASDFLDFIEETTGQSKEFLDLVGTRLDCLYRGEDIPL